MRLYSSYMWNFVQVAMIPSPLLALGLCVFMVRIHIAMVTTFLRKCICLCCSCLSQFMSLVWELVEVKGGSLSRLSVGARQRLGIWVPSSLVS